MKINYEYVKEYCIVTEEENKKLENIRIKMEKKEAMLDWIDRKTSIREVELSKIDFLSKKIRKEADIFIVVGIGGSYLGSKAVIDLFQPYFKNSIEKPEIIFSGHQLSAEYLKNLLEYIKGKSIFINVISKSGETLEPSITFQKLYLYMKENFSNYQERIIVTTDSHHGKLRDLAKRENLETFFIPEQIGGRYSVLTPVGLFPIAVTGIDIRKILEGAEEKRNCYYEAAKYAVTRKHLEEDKKVVEAITFYEEKFSFFASWMQQLFAETERKSRKGILPIINQNTTNLHSLGQYFQEGRKLLFETVIELENTIDLELENYTITMNELNNLVLNQVLIAHSEGNVPSIKITLKEINPIEIGKLIYFLETTAAISGYLNEINPFDQPGVESYKRLVNKELEKYSINK